MTQLFQTIAAIQPKLAGWCSPEKALTLAALVVGLRPAVTIEIGIYGGSSFIPLALAHKAVNRGVAIGIEPWDNSIAIQAQTENESREWWANQPMTVLRDKFLAELKALELEPFTQVQEVRSDHAPVPNAIGLLHVDGGHDDTAVRDVSRFAPRIELGGYCVLDDLNWFKGGVMRAEQRLLQMGFKKLYPLGTGAVYQRIK